MESRRKFTKEFKWAAVRRLHGREVRFGIRNQFPYVSSG